MLNRSSNRLEDKDSFQIYFKLLYKQNKSRELLEYGEKLGEDDGVSEWMCKVWSEEFVENRSIVMEWCDRLQKHYTRLLQANESNVLALMAQGAYQISKRAYLEARESLQACKYLFIQSYTFVNVQGAAVILENKLQLLTTFNWLIL